MVMIEVARSPYQLQDVVLHQSDPFNFVMAHSISDGIAIPNYP